MGKEELGAETSQKGVSGAVALGTTEIDMFIWEREVGTQGAEQKSTMMNIATVAEEDHFQSTKGRNSTTLTEITENVQLLISIKISCFIKCRIKTEIII